MDWFLLFILAVALYILAVMALGKEKGKNFTRIPGTDKAVMAPNKKGEMVRVDLPEGVTAEKVDAVFVGKKPENVKVRVKHEKTDRRDTTGNSDHDMPI